MTVRLIAALAASVSIAAAAAFVADRHAPHPTASVSLGTEAVFGAGLHEREQGRTAIRWTRERASFRFQHLPDGSGTLAVEVRGHRDWVTVSAAGRALGTLAPGETAQAFPVVVREGHLDVELRVATFHASGRDLGTQLGHVTLRPRPGLSFDARLWLAFVLPAMALAGIVVWMGWGIGAVAIATGIVAATQLALLLPWGLVRSSYALHLGVGLTLGMAGCAGLARLAERSGAGAGRWAFAAGLAALLVQGAAATWPAMIVSDALLHAHNLEKVAAGNWWLVSATQHDPPFRFPYGISFYAPLVPFVRAGLDPVAVVRAGAAASGLLMSAALFWLLLPRSPRLAAYAVLALQLLPGVFDRYSYGNLSNVFGQAMTAVLFAWLARGGRGGPLLGGAAVLLAGLGHLSSMIVVAVLLAAVVVARRGWDALPRAARVGVGVGFVLAIAYYGTFLPDMIGQAPRLLEGGQGRGAARSALDVVSRQWNAVKAEWALPALLLAVMGRPRGRDALDRDLRAYWGAGAVLALLAMVSPLEVRYLYALTLPLAVAMAGAIDGLDAERKRSGAAWILLALQLAAAAANLYDDLYFHYRP